MQKVIGIILLILTTGCGVLTNNYHAVNRDSTSPKIYRSAQMSSTRLQRAIQEEKIDVVLNLRGENKDEDWYNEEVKVCDEANVVHKSVKMSAYKRPEKEKVLKLIAILQQAHKEQKTLLLHCQGGADRSGFASAVSQMVVYNKSSEEAAKSFSIWYGCLSFNIPLDEIIDEYQPFEDKMSFQEWIETHYEKEPKTDATH